MQHQQEFDEIYRLYAADLYRFILRLCGNEQLAMDIMQDTMLKAFTDIGKFRGECSIKTWLCTVARNLWKDHLKKAENRNLPLEESWELPSGERIEDRMTDKMQAMEIHRLLHRLDEPYKEIFSLRIFAELSFQEIGSVFGKTENWARVTFFRAKKKLIELMEQEGVI
jgi:RNA polymerase sigma-70 factor (ECF subfamily)